MSDTLQEREDQLMEEEANEREIRRIRRARLGKSKTEFDMTLNQFAEKFDGEHQVTKSGTCVIPGCPCRGWSAQGSAQGSVTESKHPFDECQYDYGGGIRCCIYRSCHPGKEHLNHEFVEQSIADSEHQPAARGGGEEWRVVPSTVAPVVAEIREGDLIIVGAVSTERANQIVNEHHQHQALVAERERLRSAARNALMTLKNYEDKTGIKCPLTIKLLEDAIHEQRSTSA